MHILSPTRESNLNGSNQAERLHQRYLAKFAQKMNDLFLFSFGALPFLEHPLLPSSMRHSFMLDRDGSQ
jgi:hypothetical protein